MTLSVRISSGNGGWVQISHFSLLPEDAVAYVRFTLDADTDRLVPQEIYIESASGERLRGEHLRRFPLDVAEAYANGTAAEAIRARLETPAPQLGVLASYYAARLGNASNIATGKPPHWVQHALWSQVEEWQNESPPAPRNPVREPATEDPFTAPGPPLVPPADGRYTDDWYRSLAAAYNHAVVMWRQHGGEAPAKALAAKAGVSVNTVRSWIYRTRRAGFLPKGRQGAAG